MDWNEPGPQYYEYNKDEFGPGLTAILFLISLTIASSIIAIGAFTLYFTHLFWIGISLAWYWNFSFGVLCLLILSFLISEYSKNPIVWYIYYRKLEVTHRVLEGGEHDEMVEWIKENIKGFWIVNKFKPEYKFARKSDAMAFKLRWS